jgi:hypothetical protein
MIFPSSRLPTLPQELLDAIIENLSFDLDTLLACSLVAKPFNQATRSRLFAKITVRLDHLRKLRELRTATHSTISRSIRHLTVAIDEQVSTNEVDVRTYTEEIEKFDFSGTQHLGVSYNTHKYRETESGGRVGRVGYLHSEALGYGIFQSVLTRVTHLTIGEVTFDTLFTLQSLICTFTSLSVLELGYFKCTGGDINDYISPLIPEITLPPSLKAFSMEDTWRDSDQSDLLRWVLAHNPIPYVHAASFKYVQQPSRPLVSQYLHAAGPSVKHLTLSAGGDGGRRSFVLHEMISDP